MANISERKNKDGKVISYRIRVSRGYAPDGKKLKPFEMTWKPSPDTTAKQIQKELQRQVTLFEEECRNGKVGSNRNMKLSEFCALYLEIKRESLAPRTFEYYENLIDSLIIPQLGHLKLGDIKPAHVQQFVQYLQGNVRRKNGELDTSNPKLSPATIKRKLACLQSIMKQAVKLDLISTNPADASRLTLPKTVNPKIEIFTKQEAKEMLSCLEGEPLQFQVLIQLAIMSGARLGELVALKFSDVDFINNRITVERSAFKLKGEPITVKPPKDNDVRTITVNPYCVELIRLLMAEKQQEKMRLGSAWHNEGWIFTQWDGSIMHPQTPSKQFSAFLAKNGLQHRKFHALRHTSATLLLYGGINLRQVQERLGHGNMKTTQIYLHCVAEADQEAANTLNNLLITHSSKMISGNDLEQKAE